MICPDEINKILISCLYTNEELGALPTMNKTPPGMIPARGVMLSVGFNPTMIDLRRNRIHEILTEINPSFKEGISFMDLPFDKDKNQWGEQRNADQLLVLGIAIGELKILMPREMWPMLPGGMPILQYKPQGG